MQTHPERHDLDLFVELHHVSVITCIRIRVRWQKVGLFLLLDVVNADLVRRAFLTEHDLPGEGDDKLYRRRVDLAERLGNRVVVLFRHLVIHEELQYKCVLLLKYVNADNESALVVRKTQRDSLVFLAMTFRSGPEMTKFSRVPQCIRWIGIEKLGVAVVFVRWNAKRPIAHHAFELCFLFHGLGQHLLLFGLLLAVVVNDFVHGESWVDRAPVGELIQNR